MYQKKIIGDQGEKIEIKMYENDSIFTYLNMTFTQACDSKRNPFIMIWDTFVVKVRLMNVISIPQAFGVISMEISILLFSIIMHFTFNAFLLMMILFPKLMMEISIRFFYFLDYCFNFWYY